MAAALAPTASLPSPARLPALASSPRPQAKPPLCSLQARLLPVQVCTLSRPLALPGWAMWATDMQSHQGCAEGKPWATGQQAELTREGRLALLRSQETRLPATPEAPGPQESLEIRHKGTGEGLGLLFLQHEAGGAEERPIYSC